MRGLVSLLLLASFLSGCSDGDGSPAGEDPPATGDDPGDGIKDDGGSEGLVAARAPETFPISWDGRFGRDACVPSGPNGCTGVGVGATQGDTDLTLEAAGSTRWEIDVELTWETMNPAMTDLVLRVYSMESCGDGCMSGTRSGDSPTGPSPLVASETLPMSGNQTGLWFRVDVPRQTPSPVYAEVTDEMAFHLEGTAVAYFD